MSIIKKAHNYIIGVGQQFRLAAGRLTGAGQRAKENLMGVLNEGVYFKRIQGVDWAAWVKGKVGTTFCDTLVKPSQALFEHMSHWFRPRLDC